MSGRRARDKGNRAESGGTVYVHIRRNIAEPGIRYVVAVDPVRGRRWESSPYDTEVDADMVAAALASFIGGVRR